MAGDALHRVKSVAVTDLSPDPVGPWVSRDGAVDGHRVGLAVPDHGLLDVVTVAVGDRGGGVHRPVPGRGHPERTGDEVGDSRVETFTGHPLDDRPGEDEPEV